MVAQRITVVSTFAPDHCGIASYTSYLVAALLAEDEDVEVTVVTPSRAVPHRDGRFRVVPVPVHGADYPAQLAPVVAATRPDVVHIQHEFGIFGADERFPRLLTALAHAGLPAVVTMHTVHTDLSVDLGCGWSRGFSLDGVAIEAHQRAIGERAGLLIVHHEQSMRQTLIRQGLPEDAVVAIPHGTLHLRPGAIGRADSVPAGSPLLVAPGYLRRSKNLEVVIEAFALIAAGRPEARLWVGGYRRDSGTQGLAYLDSCVEKAQRAGIGDQLVVTRDPVSEQVMSAALASADVVFCVYDEDTRSVSGILHRALGAGAIVVASRRPKFQELAEVCDELLVDPGRPVELARLVDRILDDDGFRAAVQAPLRHLALRTAWPVVARAHLDAYTRVARRTVAVVHGGSPVPALSGR
ncbi:glycosyltransferase [Krasilnikovia sp. M28-CT-15]|uniref:glycosyltransferase n=1 Tax=Krasilnikovia sp. M28-CT-15 TaxID=3373540 RepID=UPI0038774AED